MIGYGILTEILKRWGCTVEEHFVTTDDGYEILVIQASINITQATPIVMAHGILVNSLSFVGKYNKTTAYNLMEQGYQIFFLNFRGTRYSKKSRQFSDSDRQFWYFSFHEMGIYDLRSTLKLVFFLTKQKAIIISYSMGTTATLVYTSSYPFEAQNRLLGVILLAPVSTFVNSLSLLIMGAPIWPMIRPFFENLWNGSLFPRNEEFNRFCSSGPGPIFICETLKIPLLGEDYAQMDPLYLPVTNELYVDRTGISVFDHYVQIIMTGQFRQFDYGTVKNIRVYGQIIPPSYQLSNIKVPIALFVGKNDLLASPGDATVLSVRLGSSLCGLTFISYPIWNHIDFLTAKDMNLYLNTPVLAKVAQMEQGLC
ncbi:gastric triacylglycerol lipase-like [Leptinotarsa decemlineata]|uniref:gastric triacylglycerol lipase-like n=1 Tax=Leptinotarsa decemlineata TaxID=7539 RepID=UPI003D30AF50